MKKKLQEIYYVSQSLPISLSSQSPSLFILILRLLRTEYSFFSYTPGLPCSPPSLFPLSHPSPALPLRASPRSLPPSLPLSLPLLSLSRSPSLSPSLPPSLSPLSRSPSLSHPPSPSRPPSPSPFLSLSRIPSPLSLSPSLSFSPALPRSLSLSLSLLIYPSMMWLPHGSHRSYDTDVASPGCQLEWKESTIAVVLGLDKKPRVGARFGENKELVLDLRLFQELVLDLDNNPFNYYKL